MRPTLPPTPSPGFRPDRCPGCPRCRIHDLAILAAVQEGMRQPQAVAAVVHALTCPWFVVEAAITHRRLQDMIDDGLLIPHQAGMTLSTAGRRHFRSLMAHTMAGMDPLAVAHATLQLTCLPYLPPAERPAVRAAIAASFVRGRQILEGARGGQEPGSLLHRMLTHQVTVLDHLVPALAQPAAVA